MNNLLRPRLVPEACVFRNLSHAQAGFPEELPQEKRFCLQKNDDGCICPKSSLFYRGGANTFLYRTRLQLLQSPILLVRAWQAMFRYCRPADQSGDFLFLGIGVPLAREHILLWFWWLPPADATYRSAQIRRGVHALLPGIVLPIIVALLACWLESLLPIHLIGSAVIAMFIGMFLNQFVRKTDVFATGLKFTSKKILKFAIILLGLSLNITTILHVGQMSLTVMVFTLLTCFGGGYFIGKALGLNWKLSNLISAGTGICGGSAIAAIAPTIDADDNDVAYAMSATFLFDMAMIVLFPIMGRALGMTDQAFGIWAGTAVSGTKTASKFLMVCALATIGLNTSFASMKKAGIRPMIHGFIISALVVIVALLVEMGMGIV